MNATVHSIKERPLAAMMDEFHRQYDIGQNSERKAHNARLNAATILKVMRGRVEAGECGDISWWEWFEAHSVRSRKDAEELLAIADSDDPEEALNDARERNRQSHSRGRHREKEFPVDHLKKLIGKLTDEQRQELGAWFRSEYYL